MASLEEVSAYALDEADREKLFALQRVCAVCWSTSDGWPVGVTHRYLWERGRVWVTTSVQRHRVAALRRRPQSCVIISGDGTELGPDRTLTLKTTCTVHDDRPTLEWFYEAFPKALHPGDERAQKGLAAMLDSPRRVVLELTPVKTISYDGTKLAAAIAREGVTDP
jgi:general stress protein 26